MVSVSLSIYKCKGITRRLGGGGDSEDDTKLASEKHAKVLDYVLSQLSKYFSIVYQIDVFQHRYDTCSSRKDY